MELARDPRAENEQTSILFIASSQECLKDGYSVRPIQYLYKPVDRAELAQAMETDFRLHHRPDRVTLRLVLVADYFAFPFLNTQYRFINLDAQVTFYSRLIIILGNVP